MVIGRRKSDGRCFKINFPASIRDRNGKSAVKRDNGPRRSQSLSRWVAGCFLGVGIPLDPTRDARIHGVGASRGGFDGMRALIRQRKLIFPRGLGLFIFRSARSDKEAQKKATDGFTCFLNFQSNPTWYFDSESEAGNRWVITRCNFRNIAHNYLFKNLFNDD